MAVLRVNFQGTAWPCQTARKRRRCL